MDHIGIDVHKKDSQICIVAEGGELIEQRVPTQPRRFAEALGDRPRARIVIEASTESEWVARCCAIGFPEDLGGFLGRAAAGSGGVEHGDGGHGGGDGGRRALVLATLHHCLILDMQLP